MFQWTNSNQEKEWKHN